MRDVSRLWKASLVLQPCSRTMNLAQMEGQGPASPKAVQRNGASSLASEDVGPPGSLRGRYEKRERFQAPSGKMVRRKILLAEDEENLQRWFAFRSVGWLTFITPFAAPKQVRGRDSRNEALLLLKRSAVFKLSFPDLPLHPCPPLRQPVSQFGTMQRSNPRKDRLFGYAVRVLHFLYHSLLVEPSGAVLASVFQSEVMERDVGRLSAGAGMCGLAEQCRAGNDAC